MKYFLDTEFLEGPQKEKFPISLFRKQTPNTIDLISIGIVAEDAREYYAISKDFNLKEAWNRFQWEHKLGEEPVKKYWIRDNVLEPIYNELLQKRTIYEKTHHWGLSEPFSYGSMKYLLKCFGKSNRQIAEEIISFTTQTKFLESKNGRFNSGTDSSDKITKCDIIWDNPEFYAYFADYDWVVFCWIFGKMIDLPKGFPKYCRDLKQMLDEKAKIYIKQLCIGENEEEIDEMANRSIKNQAEAFKTFKNYPKQENEHDALSDARWNKKLYKFLNSF
jgi:hypothetical protein